VIFLIFHLAIYLIVDADMGVLRSMRESARFMHGNKFTVLRIHIVVVLLGGLFVLLTCGIGTIFVFPYAMVLGAAIYLTATGQAQFTRGK
jgi:uncharacterized membrane protein